MTSADDFVARLGRRIIDGDRRALARGITLIESSRADHQQQSAQLQDLLLENTGQAMRLGISGVPGVGKSTFIETFGLSAINRGLSVAVLAVDPSSPKSGGAILGDKTRMENLSKHDNAFIRPSPSGGTLGGVAKKTMEAMHLCEAAGFDVIVIETVGVGQSETAVAELVDMFLLLISPGTGDELQGIKKGIVELADLLIVNKADGELLKSARRTRSEYRSALSMLRTHADDWKPRVLQCSSLESRGFDEIWQAIEEFYQGQKKSGALTRKRGHQALGKMWQEIEALLISALKQDSATSQLLEQITRDVENNKISPSTAARTLLQQFFKTR